MESINSLNGIGEKRAYDFEKRGIKTVEDLLYYFPRNHEDRTKFYEISDAPIGEFCSISAKVYSPVRETRIKKNFTIYSMTVFDDSGALNVVWYNNRFVKNAFRSGDEIVFFGKVTYNRGKKELQNPIYEKKDKMRFIGKIVPIYPLSGELTQKIVQSAVEQAIMKCRKKQEFIPKELREKYNFPEINKALSDIHFPDNLQDYQSARQRFVFEELLVLQLALWNKKSINERAKRKPFKDIDCAMDFIAALPFDLTNAQKRVTDEVLSDLNKPVAMNRLVQGDVGSGKTAVAAAAIYTSFKNNCQSVVMAPTEILASQHFGTFSEFFEGFGMKVLLLTKGTKRKKEELLKIANGEYDLVVGTNAVISKDVEFSNLGLCVVDEQHRFGVAQRANLMAKGENPNMLIMTATPIPRTLSLILCGDLDVSVIDELPPGRKQVETYAVGENMRRRIYAFLDKNIKAGSQAYVVCPLALESEKTDLYDAETLYKKLQVIFPDYRVGLIHGKMKTDEKDAVMSDFASGNIKILVSTTVIEVGVNVPNSNIMIIENAERFGLSTLHQLRGRVGRGQEQAYCIMFSNSNSELTKQRLTTLVKSSDGFYISEQDLKLRGPGDFFGTRQHGLPDMHLANLFTDIDILENAQNAAKDILEGKIALTDEEQAEFSKKMGRIIEESIVLN